MKYPLCQHPELFVWDFWYLYDNKKNIFHVFYLNAEHKYADSNLHHFNSKVGYAITRDFISFDWISNSVLTKSINRWDNTSIWSGDVIKTQNFYWMYYTSRDKREDSEMIQKIGRAYSKNLIDWKKDDDFLISAEKKFYDTSPRKGELTTHAWRDPFIYSYQNKNYMLVSAKDSKHKDNHSGCIALLESQDLNNWDTFPPLYSPGLLSECEVSQILLNKHGEKVLVFSNWKKHDFSNLNPKEGGLYSYNFNSKKIDILLPESSNLYACRIIPELNSDIVGFNFKLGGLQRVTTNFEFDSLKPAVFSKF